MPKHPRLRVTYANAVATLALLVAFAACWLAITGTPGGSSMDRSDGAVTAAKLGNVSVNFEDMRLWVMAL